MAESNPTKDVINVLSEFKEWVYEVKAEAIRSRDNSPSGQEIRAFDHGKVCGLMEVQAKLVESIRRLEETNDE